MQLPVDRNECDNNSFKMVSDNIISTIESEDTKLLNKHCSSASVVSWNDSECDPSNLLDDVSPTDRSSKVTLPIAIDESVILITTSPLILEAAKLASPSNFQRKRKRKSEDVDKLEKQQAGRWTDDEHQLFLTAFHQFGRNWTKVAKFIPTRSSTQVRSHAQKFFTKLDSTEESIGESPHAGVHQTAILVAEKVEHYTESEGLPTVDRGEKCTDRIILDKIVMHFPISFLLFSFFLSFFLSY